MIKFFKTHFLLLGILALTAVFRFWKIDSLPGGLFPDEAANGLDINSILRGDIQPFYERGNGREALFFYAIAAVVAFFGRGAWQHHIVSAGFGFAAVIAAYFLAKRLFGKRAALLAAFFMAVSSYAALISRTAFRANTVPLLATLTLLFLTICLQTKNKTHRVWAAAAAGLSFALGFYTYTSFRMMLPLLIFMTAVFLMYVWRSKDLRYKNVAETFRFPFLAFAGVFAAGISWLAWYFIKHPGSFVGRAGQVSIFSDDLNNGDVLATFLRVFKATILSFFTEGDMNWRHNVAGAPFLPPLISPLFAAGLLAATIAIFLLLRQAWRGKIKGQTIGLALVAAWFWLMLVPEVTTAEGIPHGLRLIGVIPAIFILPALAADKVWKFLSRSRLKFLFNTKYVLAVFFLGTLFFTNFSLYFGAAAGSPDYHYAFRSDLAIVSQYLNERNQPEKTYLSLDKFSVQTVEYLTTEKNQPYILVDPARTYEVRLKKGDQVVFTQSTIFDRKKFVERHPKAVLVRVERNKFTEFTMLVYEMP